MQKLQDSVFSIAKTTGLSPAVFSFLQPTEDNEDKEPLGGILSDTKHGWLALGPRFCVVDLRTGLKVAARIFGTPSSNLRTKVTSVVELPTPLTDHSQQLLIALECEDIAGMICVFHINGSQLLKCIQTDIIVTELAVCDGIPDGPFTCFDGVVMAGTKSGEIFVFDLNRASLIQALKGISQGYGDLIRDEENPVNVTFLPLTAVNQIDAQRDLALENEDHIAVILNETSLVDGQYIFRNPDGSVRMKAKRDHIKVTVLQFIPQLGSFAVGFNFGAFQIWNIMTMDLEFTSQVNVECLPVTHFGFQEPCDDPRAFCYLWVVFSVLDRFDEEEFPLAVMYSLTYQGKRMLSDTKCLYQEFLMATIRFQVELGTVEEEAQLVGGKCISCHTYSVQSCLGGDGEENMVNICQLVWECWGEHSNSSGQHGLLLFDLDQWYKDQMPATSQLCSNAFMSATRCPSPLAAPGGRALDVRLDPRSVSGYSARAPTRLEEHFYPNSLHYKCVSLNTSEAYTLSTIGIQRQIVNALDAVGPTALLRPARLFAAAVAAGLTPLYVDVSREPSQDEQRRFLLSVALEARLPRLLSRAAHDWATGAHANVGCTLPFLVDWAWDRAMELKENAREMTTPLFTSSAVPDGNVVRCLDHCVQQLTQLTGLLDSILTKCCNLLVPEALSALEARQSSVRSVAVFFTATRWLLLSGLLPERAPAALPYPAAHLANVYTKRRLKLHRLASQWSSGTESESEAGAGAGEGGARRPCPLLYVDQLIQHEFGGERIRELWQSLGSACHGLYPPPSLYALLRLYLLPGVAERHTHELVLYMLVDYSTVYDEVRYEEVIRRLMQFPTMFGLSNTAIKATQAFWHLDHRDFDFALDQLQCLTGNTLSEWQHKVVLSSLLAQKKTQAALQYLHVRKPAPIQNVKDENSLTAVSDHDKLEDWQSCCNLYLARGLVFEALDVVRMCAQNAGTLEEKVQVLNFFFKGCRRTGRLSRVVSAALSPCEEEAFTRYLEACQDPQTSDILVMYYLQQARYLEAEQYNKKLKQLKQRRDICASVESLTEAMDRETARDTLVEVVCASLPTIATSVAQCALIREGEPRAVVVPKPMSVFIQAKSPRNTFTYKSTFIQETLENASETWISQPKLRAGMKRALNVEETPFICTPKLSRTKSLFTEQQSSDATPPKRPRAPRTPRTPHTPHTPHTPGHGGELGRQISRLLEMPDIQSPEMKLYERSGAETPHSILKVSCRSPASVLAVDSSDDELADAASHHTHYSDSTNKHLRFTIPTASEGSTPSPIAFSGKETETSAAPGEREVDVSMESYVTTTESHAMVEPNPLESPPKKFATPDNVRLKKNYKDTVRARHSLSISANSSLSDDPNTSVESIADLPVTLINPRYSGGRRQSNTDVERASERESDGERREGREAEMPKTPRGRRGIRASGESTPVPNRSRSLTPERQDSPITPLRPLRITRSRSRTPELSPRPLPAIPEGADAPSPPSSPSQTSLAEDAPMPYTRSVSDTVLLRRRGRSRTPERSASPRLAAISEAPADEPPAPATPSPAPPIRSLRSRRTSEVDIDTSSEEPERPSSPRSLRSRAKTPEKIITPKKEIPRSTKKSLSRIVLEANTFAKTKQESEKPDTEADDKILVRERETQSSVETTEKGEQTQSEVKQEKTQSEPVERSVSIIECTPMKTLKPVSNLMDVTISPIVSKSMLQSSNESVFTDSAKEKMDESGAGSKSLPIFTMNETRFGKSVLNSFDSTVADTTNADEDKVKHVEDVSKVDKSVPGLTLSESRFGKSMLLSYESSVAETSSVDETADQHKYDKPSTSAVVGNVSGIIRSILGDVSGVDRTKDKSMSEAAVLSRSMFQDISSLMTSDSSIDVDDRAKSPAKEDKATHIQTEKKRIGEIEREISEIEGDMLDEDAESEESASEDGDEEVEEEEDEEAGEDVEADEEGDQDVEEDEEGDQDVEEDGEGDQDVEEDEEGDQAVEEDEEVDQYVEVNAESDQDVEEDEEGDEDGDEEDEDDDDEDDDNESAAESEVDEQEVASNEEDVISIDDSGSNKSSSSGSSSNKLEIDEGNSEQQVVEVNQVTETRQDADISSIQDEEVSTDPLNRAQVSIMTDDNSKEDQTEMSLNYSDEEQNDDKIKEVAARKIDNPVPAMEILVNVESVSSEDTQDVVTEDLVKRDLPLVAKVSEDEDNIIIEIKPRATEKSVETEKITTADKEMTTAQDGDVKQDDIEKPVTRKRKSASRKSSKAAEPAEVIEISEEPRTPMTRKRSQSVAGSEPRTPETEPSAEPNTPTSRRRSKTPPTEVRKIITRRASRELSGILDESQPEELLATPKRRATRSRSKNLDEVISIASDSSVRSIRSKASEDAGEPTQARKGRKSVLSTRPDLSVIPESAAEESTLKESNDDIVNDYSSNRRLTRHQKAVLHSWLPSGRAGDAEQAHSSHSSRSSIDMQTLDRVNLLNKGSFEGSPDPSEQMDFGSPSDSIASDASKQRRLRMTRAASETKTTPKAAKVGRRVSVNIGNASEMESPAGSRGRRASFNRACEALLTPKGRRTSTDLKKSETDSQPSSPGSARRSRRGSAASTGPAASAALTKDTPKRSRRASTIDEESKETNKK